MTNNDRLAKAKPFVERLKKLEKQLTGNSALIAYCIFHEYEVAVKAQEAKDMVAMCAALDSLENLLQSI